MTTTELLTGAAATPPPPRSTHPVLLLIAVIAVLVLGTLVVFVATGGGDDEPVSPAPSAAVDWESAAAAAGLPAKPDQATADAYIAALAAIDPDIVAGKDPDRIVGRGRDACAAAARHPGDTAAAVEAVRLRFTAPGHPGGFTGDVPARIWEVVQAHLCPGR